MNKNNGTKIVLVTGDVTIDWNIARILRQESITQAWYQGNMAAAFCQYGGAAMLGELISAVSHNLNQENKGRVEVRQVDLSRQKITPADPYFPQSYAMWAPFPKTDKSRDMVWRVQDFLGLKPAGQPSGAEDTWKDVANEDVIPHLIVISDANLGFRTDAQRWPNALREKRADSWVIVNTSKPVASGPLWDYLLSNYCSRIIAVISANDLRSEQIQISRHLSWESTVKDAIWELTYNPSINRLKECAYTIISFGTAGVMLCKKTLEGVPEATLFFDSKNMEDDWNRHYKGSVIGYASSLVAAIAREVLLNTDKPDIEGGIQKGIQAMRHLQIVGYGTYVDKEKAIQLKFPAAEIVSEITNNTKQVTSVKVPTFTPKEKQPQANSSDSQEPMWTILQEKHTGSLVTLAEEIIRKGLESALSDVPFARFNDLNTIDRREIEALQSISNLMSEYIGYYQKTPLSIAVFGPPGSGKSFTVKQVAETVAPGNIVPLTFNLSQFNSPEDLYDAFHQIRDKALTGKIPLVFWDEFDTSFQQQKLGWLRYFLAPMQDGEFQEGQVTHTIGRCIFIFAGGTTNNIDAFTSKINESEPIAAKLPDFISRLKGFLNVLGPDPTRDNKDKIIKDDPYFILRRAILLRSIIERTAPKLMQNDGTYDLVTIDPGVLRALLNVRQYKHGARSMEAIIKMSQLSDKSVFERSSLPSEHQLDLHVNGREFTAIMNQLELNNENTEIMAISFHKTYCEFLEKKNYRWGPVTDDAKKLHSSLMPYAELPEDEKEQNRNNVRDIPRKLEKVGYLLDKVRYILITNRNNEPKVKFQDDEIEILAEQEHIRWMNQKLDGGWKWAERTDKPRKLHKDIVPWEKLEDEIKENDRVMIRAIPDIIATAGYIMFKLS
jgi:hypothetical protein